MFANTPLEPGFNQGLIVARDQSDPALGYHVGSSLRTTTACHVASVAEELAFEEAGDEARRSDERKWIYGLWIRDRMPERPADLDPQGCSFVNGGEETSDPLEPQRYVLQARRSDQDIAALLVVVFLWPTIALRCTKRGWHAAVGAELRWATVCVVLVGLLVPVQSQVSGPNSMSPGLWWTRTTAQTRVGTLGVELATLEGKIESATGGRTQISAITQEVASTTNPTRGIADALANDLLCETTAKRDAEGTGGRAARGCAYALHGKQIPCNTTTDSECVEDSKECTWLAGYSGTSDCSKCCGVAKVRTAAACTRTARVSLTHGCDPRSPCSVPTPLVAARCRPSGAAQNWWLLKVDEE